MNVDRLQQPNPTLVQGFRPHSPTQNELSGLTVWLGLRDPPRAAILRSGDYSYGIYLYGFVIQQLVMDLIGERIGSALALFAIALPTSAAIAVLSWHVVERPALRLKRILSAYA